MILLHGLGRTAASMAKMAGVLADAGFRTCNLSYPSTSHSVAELAENFVLPQILACQGAGTGPLSFVTHSMGGILVRCLAEVHPELDIGRVVMLAPPNQGSEVAETLSRYRLFRLIFGPAGREMGTGPKSVPKRLGPPPFEAGIIAGDRSIEPWLSLLIPGPNDGKVAVNSARLPGMRDFLVIHACHPLIMRNRLAIAQAIHFLRQGSFRHEGNQP